MTFNELIEKLGNFYPDNELVLCVKHTNSRRGTRLARFIVDELRDAYDAGDDDEQQLLTAMRAIDSAVEELALTSKALASLVNTEQLRKMEARLKGR